MNSTRASLVRLAALAQTRPGSDPPNIVGPVSRRLRAISDSMPAIAAAVAVVWAVFLTLVTLVLAYYAFVVSERQAGPIERTDERSREVAAPDAQSAQ